MIYSIISRFSMVVTAFAFFGKAVCSPLAASEFSSLDNKARGFLERSTKVSTTAPHFVIYSDRYISGSTGPPPVDQVKVIIF